MLNNPHARKMRRLSESAYRISRFPPWLGVIAGSSSVSAGLASASARFDVSWRLKNRPCGGQVVDHYRETEAYCLNPGASLVPEHRPASSGAGILPIYQNGYTTDRGVYL